jgi:hypothetical protein
MKHRRKQDDAPQTLSFSLVRRRPDRLRELDRCARLVDKVSKARDLEVGYEAHAKKRVKHVSKEPATGRSFRTGGIARKGTHRRCTDDR